MNITWKTWFAPNKNRTKKRRLKPMNCSPAVKNKRAHSQTCFTPEILFKIRDTYNAKHTDDKIVEKDPTKVWWELKNKLACEKESCWLSQLGNNESVQIERYIFAPKHPPEWKSNPDEWLSNFDIEDVAKQYETSHPEFKLIGPTTIDFDTKLPEKGGTCVLNDLCEFSLDRFIKAKKTKIGIVFNLDKHDQSGSHWVSMFIDIQHRFVFFFDSADNPIPREIWEEKPKGLPLVNRILDQAKELGFHFTFYNNRGHSHQNSNTECGMYSLFFIITMLTGETSFTKGVMSISARRNLFLKKRIPDKVVFQYRKLYFND